MGGLASWQLLRFIRCSDFSVRDLILDGNRDRIGPGAAWGHALRRLPVLSLRGLPRHRQGDGFALNADLDRGHHDP